jgi:competence protein ComEC
VGNLIRAMRRLAAPFVGRLIAERSRWALWIPAGLGLGIATYFSLPEEPPLWTGPAVLAVVAAAGLGLAGPPARPRRGLRMAALGLAILAGGFTAAQVRTALVEAPMLPGKIGPTTVSGRVERAEARAGSTRITISQVEIAGLSQRSIPERVQLRLRGEQPPLHPGQRVRVRAELMPPAPPATPGAFDYQRQSFFDRRGAVGFAYGRVTVIPAREGEGRGQVGLAVAQARQRIGERVRAQVPGPRGTVAAALITGETGAIPEAELAAMRDSGLAHLLSISGLHIGLVAGILFLAARSLLALIQPIALRYPIKKWAAVVAVAGAGAYTLLAGAPVPTQRSFLMVGLVFLAVLLDRRGLSMRSLAWAATAILVLAPESLLTASFQMSFAAVTALIAWYEVVRERRIGAGEPPRWPMKMVWYLGGVVATTIVAGAATTPFAAYHFNRIAGYGVAANLVAVPVTSLWVMPWAVLAFVLMPFGLDGLALTAMGWGVGAVLWIAAEVAAWPGSASMVPAMPMWGLVAVAVGGLWLCLWRQRWRLLGIGGLAAGAVAAITATPPDLLVSGDGRLVAARSASGELMVSSLRRERFLRNAWLQRNGQEARAARWPESGASADGRLTCDGLGCIFRVGGRVVAIPRRPDALDEDCATADVVVSPIPVRNRCPSAATVIDLADLRRDGAHALWLHGGTVRVASVNGRRGDRPWVAGGRGEDGEDTADDD